MNTQKSISQIWKELRAKYEVMRSDKPLAIGTDNQLYFENDGYSVKEIQAVLRRHTRTDTYLRNVKFGTTRYTLDGTVIDVVTDVQRELARLHLNERSQKRLMIKINTLKPAKTPKKLAAREAKHNGRLIRIHNKIEAAKVSLEKEKIEYQCSLATGDVGFFNN